MNHNLGHLLNKRFNVPEYPPAEEILAYCLDSVRRLCYPDKDVPVN